MASFNDFNLTKPLLNALDDLGIHTPTLIQEKTFSVIMSGKDVLGIAQTGTGKTLAFLLPTLRQWTFSKSKYPQIIIIVPTRELVVQICDEIEKLCKYMSVVCVGVYGGANINKQWEEIRNGMDILVSTPGRLVDFTLKDSMLLKSVKKLIIDEVDETLNLGFRFQLTTILEALPVKKQSLLFSATISEEVEKLINDYFIAPVKVEAARIGTPLENIEQYTYDVPNFFTKINLLKHILQNDKTITKLLVFASTKTLADELAETLEPLFPETIGVIHSNKSQNLRFNTVQEFHEGKIKMLIATDLVARGIDISEVSHVINFDTPELPDNYIHRIGRTGRADKKGIAITFTSLAEEALRDEIESFMSAQLQVLPFPDEVEISDKLAKHEQPKIDMPYVLTKVPKKENVGPAFHEKSEKNKKVNVRKDWKKIKMEKYGKPIKKSGKPNK